MGASKLKQVAVRGTAWAILGLLLASGCSGDEERAKPTPTNQFPDQILTDFRVEMTRGDLHTAVIVADKGVVYRKRDSMIVEELEADLYDNEGVLSSKLWADSGLVRERRQEMVAFGNVRLIGRDSVRLYSDSLFWYGSVEQTEASGKRQAGMRKEEHRYMVARKNVHLVTKDTVHLWTDTLVWDDLKRTVATDAYVRIVRRFEDTLQGIGLRSDDELKRITILERVSGRIGRPPK